MALSYRISPLHPFVVHALRAFKIGQRACSSLSKVWYVGAKTDRNAMRHRVQSIL